jgi:hypothetical protein
MAGTRRPGRTHCRPPASVTTGRPSPACDRIQLGTVTVARGRSRHTSCPSATATSDAVGSVRLLDSAVQDMGVRLCPRPDRTVAPRRHNENMSRLS